MTYEDAIRIIKNVDICANAAETARNMAIDALRMVDTMQKTQQLIIDTRDLTESDWKELTEEMNRSSPILVPIDFEPVHWISVEDRLPTTFVSVLGYMTDAGEFPAVRECYCIGDNEFYFPALFERHPVSHWMPMPDAPKERRGD